ncbi:hypothetical protein [Egicoccus halophilus]|uniref:Uncharacterized protein n=1 Tax=Egicoccus halophilus TaxID=1670830 RepID=A0A8J3EUG8_9ACTN|nr:hypothetical protein [Egicoccus halophilus]GGI07696.1 hypothetical protein GCM10011354_25380 [Egicoccus halophilus]
MTSATSPSATSPSATPPSATPPTVTSPTVTSPTVTSPPGLLSVEAASVPDPLTALPVVLALSSSHAERVRSWVEGVLGWQPVEAVVEPLVPPRLCLTDVGDDADRRDPLPAGVPVVLLVAPDDPPTTVAAHAVHLRPVATLCWPQDRDRLEDAARTALRVPADARGDRRLLRVGGAAGGVGTSTVVAALAGLFGWQGHASLAVVGPGAPVGAVRDVAVEALAGTGLWSQASALPGVPRTRAVRVPHRPSARVVVGDAAVEVAVVDAGVDDDVDVLVTRPDAAGLTAARRTTAAVVVVVGNGPAPRAAVQEACGARRRVHLPRSARVARAGLLGRVPAGLPGSWLRPLIGLTHVRGGDPP